VHRAFSLPGSKTATDHADLLDRDTLLYLFLYFQRVSTVPREVSKLKELNRLATSVTVAAFRANTLE
jgi:hypothetical protein